MEVRKNMLASQTQPRIIKFEEGQSKIYSDGISKLERIIQEGMRGRITNKEFADLYTIVYRMCTQKEPYCHTSALYERFNKCINDFLLQSHTELNRDSLLNTIENDKGRRFLEELSRQQKNFALLRKWLVNFFVYLNRFYVKRHHKDTLEEVCLSGYRQHIYSKLHRHIVRALLSMIDQDRSEAYSSGKVDSCLIVTDRSLIRDVVQIFVDIGGCNSTQNFSNYSTQNVLKSPTEENEDQNTQLENSATSPTSPTTFPTNLIYYKRDFERGFLSATLNFYSNKALDQLKNYRCNEYLIKVEETFAKERRRLTDFLHFSTEEQLIKVLIKSLLLKHQSEIIGNPDSGFIHMLENNKQQDLHRVYSLYKGIQQSLIPLAKMFRNHVTKTGTSIVMMGSNSDEVTFVGSGKEISGATGETTKQSPRQIVEQIVSIFDRFFSLVNDIFENNSIFDKAFKEAFETFMNHKLPEGQSIAEFLAIYCDALLSRTTTTMTVTQPPSIQSSKSESPLPLEASMKNIALSTDQNFSSKIEDNLDKSVRLFMFLSDKDLFQEYYRKMLAKRLLSGRSSGEDSERFMIGKLKLCSGAQFTSKLEGMINDIRLAQEHKSMFRQYLVDNRCQDKLNGIELSVQVLTTTYWPSYPTEKHQLHSHMKQSIELFQKYYDKRTSNRVLRWIHSLGSVVIAANFSQNRCFLEVSTIQACILLLLNTCPKISITNLHKALNVPLNEIKKQLKPLVHPKYFRILLKNPPAGYDPSHEISINLNCNPPRKRIRLPIATSALSDQERAKNMSEINENRKHAIEASLVRVMKSRKRLEYSQLVAEVSNQLMQHFKPDPRLIRNRVEDLINREYLERDKTDPNIYVYLA